MDLKKKKFSLVYKNIHIYRFIMNIIYLGKYNERFKIITDLFNPKTEQTIVELCFGDIIIAHWCKLNKINWIGFDINQQFIKNAKLKGYNAHYRDILKLEVLPRSDAVVLMGSLYQFHESLNDLINCVMNSTSKFIISEPIRNIASTNNIFGYLAKRLTKVGNGNEQFRYDYHNLYRSIRAACNNKFIISEIKKTQKDLILVIQKI
tara:strand:+ start:9433 stop:10050 length:618 start_codon:yes stop_codon:yes gene_type:complete